MRRCSGSSYRWSGAARAPDHEALAGAAAARRLDDAFRTYLAERGAKPVPLAGITNLVTGVAGLRLAADAIVELWGRDDGTSAGDRADAARELRAISGRVAGWYGDFALSLTDGVFVPVALADTPGASDRRTTRWALQDCGVEEAETAPAA